MINRICCSCQLPLDLEEDHLALEGEALSLKLSRLDVNGWNTEGVIRRLAWVRTSVLVTRFREEILELSLGPAKENMEQTAR